MAKDSRVDIARGILAEDAVDVPCLGDHASFIQMAIVDTRKRFNRLDRAGRREATVDRTMNEQRRNGELAQVSVAQIVVRAVGSNHVTRACDRGKMAKSHDIRGAEHLRYRVEGTIVELFKLIKLPVQCCNAAARQIVAAVVRSERIGETDHSVYDALKQGAVRACARVNQVDSECAQKVGRAQEC